MLREFPGSAVDVDNGEKLRKEEVKMETEIGGVASFPLFYAKTKDAVIRSRAHYGR